MKAFRDESEEHTVRRLEAFSDIVIGFSLAMLTLNLKIPRHAIDLFTTDSVTLVAFLFTFTLVASLWWLHHKLFTSYFVPNALSIYLNFAALAGVLLMVFTEQMFLRVGQNDPFSYALFTGCYGIVIVLIAGLTTIGIHTRGDRLAPSRLRRGRFHVARLFGMGVVMLGIAFAMDVLHQTRAASWGLAIFAVFALATRLLDARARAAEGVQ